MEDIVISTHLDIILIRLKLVWCNTCNNKHDDSVKSITFSTFSDSNLNFYDIEQLFPNLEEIKFKNLYLKPFKIPKSIKTIKVELDHDNILSDLYWHFSDKIQLEWISVKNNNFDSICDKSIFLRGVNRYIGHSYSCNRIMIKFYEDLKDHDYDLAIKRKNVCIVNTSFEEIVEWLYPNHMKPAK